MKKATNYEKVRASRPRRRVYTVNTGQRTKQLQNILLDVYE